MSQMTLTSRVAATASGLLILGMSFVGLASATDVIARMAVAESSARVRRVFVLSLHLCGTKAGVANRLKSAEAGGSIAGGRGQAGGRLSLIWRSLHVAGRAG